MIISLVLCNGEVIACHYFRDSYFIYNAGLPYPMEAITKSSLVHCRIVLHGDTFVLYTITSLELAGFILIAWYVETYI